MHFPNGPSYSNRKPACRYAPAGGAADAIVDDVLAAARLPPRGAAYGARGFADGAAVDVWLLANPNTTDVALLFDALDPATGLSYTVQYNGTAICRCTRVPMHIRVGAPYAHPNAAAALRSIFGVLGCNAPGVDYAATATVAVDAALIRAAGGHAGFDMRVKISNFPHPDNPAQWDLWAQYGGWRCVLYACIVRF